MHFLTLSLLLNAVAALPPLEIPQSPGKHFRSSGVFEGGIEKAGKLEAIRMSARGGFERWVIDFMGKKGIAPRFQLRYEPEQKNEGDNGTQHIRSQARFVLLMKSVQKNQVTRAQLQSLIRRSRLVKDVVLYPAIENGDTALEITLHKDVLFDAHQPRDRQGLLVLDMKAKAL